MGEKLFLAIEVNSAVDARVAGKGLPAMVEEAGLAYQEGVQSFVDGVREGREDVVAAAKPKIAEASTCLDALGKAVLAVKEQAEAKGLAEAGKEA